MARKTDISKWFVAQLVMEITVQDSARNVVHRNSFLISAGNAEMAYRKAVKKGLSGEVSYQNPRDKLVTIRFRGLSSLIEVMDPLEDGGEIMWNERVGVSEKTIIGMIPAKERLAVFRPRPAFPSIREPNYASKEVVEELIRRLKAKPR